MKLPVNTRRDLLLATGVGLSTTVAGCVFSDDGDRLDGETIRIGVMGKADGYYAAESLFTGSRIAIDHLNETDGIAGADVELVVAQTGERHDDAALRKAHSRLCDEEDCDVTVGDPFTQSPSVLLQSIGEHETVHLTTGTISDMFGTMVSEAYDDYKYHFRAGMPAPADLGTALATFIEDNRDEFGWDRVAIGSEDPLGMPFHSPFQDSIDEVSDLVHTYQWREQDKEAKFEDVLEIDPDVLIDVSFEDRYGATAPWMGADYPFDYGGFLVPATKRSFWGSEGIGESAFTLNAVSPKSDDPDTEAFIDAYRTRTDEYPLYSAATTFDAIITFREAVEAILDVDAGSELPSRERIVEALEAGTFTDGIVYDELTFTGPDAEKVHEPEWTSMSNSGVPVVQQWQPREDGRGVLETIAPERNRTAEYRHTS